MFRCNDGGRPRTSRNLILTFEGMDPRALPSAGVGPTLGSFLAPGTKIPKVATTSAVVNPQAAVGSFLTSLIGPGVSDAQAASQAQQTGSMNLVANQVAKQPLVNSLLSRQDTYDLLNAALSDSNGAAGSSYSDTSTILASALKTATHRPAPNAPRAVPGLRLPGAFAKNRNFANREAPGILKAFRIAVTRQVFALSAQQQSLVADGYAQFVQNVESLQASGAFQPAVPPGPASLPRGPLTGTIEVTAGAFRTLNSVAASQSGLPLPSIGNFQGRIDIGYVIDRQGNFGIALTARGPLLGAPANVASSDVIGGDVQVEVSNASNISALNGLRLVEGLNQGAAISGGLESSKTPSGASTFGASIGYGSGLEFGTNMAYTQVIPLGNEFALIPEYPKQ